MQLAPALLALALLALADPAEAAESHCSAPATCQAMLLKVAGCRSHLVAPLPIVIVPDPGAFAACVQASLHP